MGLKALKLCSKEPVTCRILNHKNPLDSLPSHFFQAGFIRVPLDLSLRLPNMGNSGKSAWNVFSTSVFHFGCDHYISPLAQPHKTKSLGDNSVGPPRPGHLPMEVAVKPRANNKRKMSWWSIAHKMQFFLQLSY